MRVTLTRINGKPLSQLLRICLRVDIGCLSTTPLQSLEYEKSSWVTLCSRRNAARLERRSSK